ncbi:MAG: HAD-IIA family hydrolase [Deltaproteobacteria bacterium]|nr:MAG: HAD-IIA family hydrolase [Deltaproteobacteria bacterium]
MSTRGELPGSVEAFLLDLDGTIYLGDRLLPGAAAWIEFLREGGYPFLFLTNNSARDATAYARKLERYGLAVSPEEILTSGEATARYLRQEGIVHVFPIGTPAFEAEFRRRGIILDGADISGTEAVVVGFDTTLTYAKLEAGCRLLLRGARFIASHPDYVCPTEREPLPDCGAICAAITAATGLEPTVVGKPSAFMVQVALEKLGVPAEKTAIVGDRLYTDIRMGIEGGIFPILVLTGETKEGDLAQSPWQPGACFPSVRELHGALARRDP